VLAGEQAPALHPGVDPGQGLPVVAGRGHGGDVGDDVGPVFGAGLGDVGEVSRPASDLAAAGVARGRVAGSGRPGAPAADGRPPLPRSSGSSAGSGSWHTEVARHSPSSPASKPTSAGPKRNQEPDVKGDLPQGRLTECWFGYPTDQKIGRGVHNSV
jgi:hypothetical protein